MSINESFNKLDLSGKLIIKACYGDDIRRIPIHNDDLTYDELVLMMQRVFKGSLDAEEDILLKYKDEDGDLITITDNSDLTFAIQYCRVLRLTIITNTKENKNINLTPQTIKNLREIRDAVNRFLDESANHNHDLKESIQPAEKEIASEDSGLSSVFNGFKEESKEFDPLTNKQTEVQKELKQEFDTQSISSHSSVQPETDPSHFAGQTHTSFPNTYSQSQPPALTVGAPSHTPAPTQGGAPSLPTTMYGGGLTQPPAMPSLAGVNPPQVGVGAHAAAVSTGPVSGMASSHVQAQPSMPTHPTSYPGQAAYGNVQGYPGSMPSSVPGLPQHGAADQMKPPGDPPALGQLPGQLPTAPRPMYPPPAAVSSQGNYQSQQQQQQPQVPAAAPPSQQMSGYHSPQVGAYNTTATTSQAAPPQPPAATNAYAATSSAAGYPAGLAQPPVSAVGGYQQPGYQYPGGFGGSQAAPPANPYSRGGSSAGGPPTPGGYAHLYPNQQGYK